MSETRSSKDNNKDKKRSRQGSERATRKPARATKGEKAKRNDKERSAALSASRDLALLIAHAALEKKAAAVEILDVVGRVDYADFLVLMTGRSARHVDALAQEIESACERVKKKRALAVEGLPAAVWVLLDFGDVVVHVFQEQARGLYDIEGLWLDANRLPVPGETMP
jgi:ribosome-associated protein